MECNFLCGNLRNSFQNQENLYCDGNFCSSFIFVKKSINLLLENSVMHTLDVRSVVNLFLFLEMSGSLPIEK